MQINRYGKPYATIGTPPEVGEPLPNFTLKSANEKTRITTKDLLGKPLLISVVPNINTRVCTTQTIQFNRASDLVTAARFVTISTNTCAEQLDWCGIKGVTSMEMLSDADASFGEAMALYMPTNATLARAVFIVAPSGKIIYREFMTEQTNEPDYLAALNFIRKFCALNHLR
ncbi:peroxiredoxin [Loigolactobacillus backii]|uniref:2-Cys peroxiredoxin n=1 Tax=Loigolactobacillus backii TaxID=375175 RepID=A0A192H058_9LACO|nr:peroxiredoxin [Loigolactobacillus backii]ANK60693.1 2-Cys peroxiredoxin [Loigolactobacillus backii]ANK61740.1 2-Cys peroxiredoxin [Loigolactobacillus backii]ANK68123.1 2-Cys peroxiredoxin [Loigolactobacillus backii]MDA5388494.1 peroxiredoxin [Loigolactobacillus backii]MDA5390968.1 peroxiredoxin [Loigolactobacillus backii]